MAYGARFINDSGIVQIDGSFQNLSLALRQSFAIDQNNRVSISLANCISPIFCISSDSVAVGIVYLTFVNNTYTWTLGAAGFGIATAYIFDIIQPPRSSSYGLSIRNASGVEVFNGSTRPCKVVAALNVPFENIRGHQNSYSLGLPVGQYAVALNVPRLTGVSNASDSGYTDGVQTYPDSVVVQHNIRVGNYSAACTGFVNSFSKPNLALVLDVTGI